MTLAAAILNALEIALKEGAPMGQAMKDAYEKAVEAVEKAWDWLRILNANTQYCFGVLLQWGY